MLKLVAIVALIALITFAAADMSAEEREEFAAMKAQFAAMKAESALPAGALLTFVDGRTVCPKGTIEANITQGMVLVGRPKNGKTGAVFNRPFDAGEIGRTPAHSHAVSVNDPGHTHVNIVHDPGHEHSFSYSREGKSGGDYDVAPHTGNGGFTETTTSTTGIAIEALPTESGIEVSMEANDAGEHYPLVYVLLCQKLP